MCMLVLSVECSGLLAAMMKGNKQIAIATLLVLAVILTLRECSGQDIGIELTIVDMSCNSLTVMVTTIPEEKAMLYNLWYRKASQTNSWTKKTNLREKMHNISQLLPNTTYTVRVKRKGMSEPIAKKFTTLSRSDIADNVTVVASTNSLEIKNNLADVNLTCWINGIDTVKDITISGMSGEVVDRVSPNTTYSVDCVEVDEEGQYQCMEYNGTVTTLLGESPTVPGQPTNITVNKTCNSLTLSWLPPGEDGGSIITDYNVTVVNGTEDGLLLESVPTGGNNTVRITSLKSNTTYTVHIRARNSAGGGLPAVVNVTTEELKVTGVNITFKSAKEVKFRLPKSNENFTCTVLKESANTSRVSNTAVTNVKIVPLTPNTTYSIRCIGIEDQCVEVDQMFTTATIKDTAIELTIVDMSCNSLTVMWTEIPKDKPYDLQYKPASQKSTWTRINTKETMHNITQLLPNTTYEVKVKKGNKVGLKDYTTLARKGIGDKLTVMVSTNSLEIENKLSDVNITCWINGRDTVKNITISGMSREVVDGLSPNTTYSVDCVEVDEEGQYQCMEYNGTVTTLIGESPGQPTNITVIKTCNSLTLSWLPPEEDGGANVTDYNVTVVNGTEDGPLLESVPTGGNTTVRITSLKSNTMYTVHIRARNSAGLGPPAVVSATTEELKVSKVFHNSVSATKVTFRLLESSGNFTCTVLKESTNSPVFNSTVSAITVVTIESLTPNTTYSIRCSGIENQCAEVDRMFTTATIKVPGQPSNTTVNTTCNSLTLSWLPPGEDGGSNVTDYIVTVVNGTEDGPLLESVPTGGNTTVRITSLKPNTTYTVHIKARNSVGQGPPAVVNATTEELKVSKVYRNSESATEVTFRLQESNGNFTCTVLGESTNRHVFNSTVSAGTDVKIDTITPNTTYSIRCFGIEGQCVEVDEMFTTATIKAPGQPTNITVNKTCNSLTLSWLPPKEDGGSIITDYIVTVVDGTDSEDGPLLESVPTGGNTTVRITSLKPNTMYTVHIRARNSAGEGPPAVVNATTEKQTVSNEVMEDISHTNLSISWTTDKKYICWVNGTANNFTLDTSSIEVGGLTSDTVYSIRCVEVDEDGHYQCKEYNTTVVTGLPPVTGLMACEVDSRSAVNSTHFNQTIEWTEVSSYNQKISYYIVNYQRENYKNSSVQNTTLNSATLTLPLPTSPTTYNVWVAAVSDSTGTGEYSEVLEINYTAPTEPVNLTVSGQKCNQLNLTWNVPRNTGGLPIINYQITYRQDPGGEVISDTIVSEKTMTTLTNLLPGTTYSIEVRANNSIISNKHAVVHETTTSRGESKKVMANVTSSITFNISQTTDKKYICWVNDTTNNYTLATSSIEVDLLTPDTVYSIGCVEVDEDGHYQCTEYNTTIVTAFSEVTNLRVLQSTTVNNSCFNQRIDWNKVTSDNQNISHYIIKYGLSSVVNSYDSEGVNSTTSTTNSTTLTLPLPTSATTYNVWVAAVSKETGTGEYSEVLEINYTAPIEPRNLTVSAIKCNKLKLTWDKPENTGGLPIINYLITYRKDPNSEEIIKVNNSPNRMTTKLLKNLLPNTSYMITVRANNSIMSDNNAVKNGTTKARSKSNKVMANVTSSTTFNISRTTDKKYICWVNDTTNNYTLDTSSIEVDQLTPDTVYSIGCVEVDKDGHYQCTEYNTTIVTGLPQVTDLKWLQSTAGNDTHFNQRIDWNKVTSDNQNISHYIIKYGLSSIVNSYDSGGVNSTKSTTNSTTLTLPLPTSPTTYNVWVAAVSGKSVTGEYSEGLKINYTAPTRPMKLTVFSITCNQLNLTWAAPENTGGLPIINYEIKYRENPGREFTTVTSTEAMVTLDNLLPETIYEIEVRANNSIISETNTEIKKTTPERIFGASDIMVNITSSMTFNISRTTDKKYICWVNGTKHTLNTSSIKVDGLTPDAVYPIRCVEVDEVGDYQCTEYNTTVHLMTEPLGEMDVQYWIIAAAVAAGGLLLAVVCCFCVIIIVVCVRDQRSKGTYNFNEEAICLQDIVAAVMDDSMIALQNMQRKDPIPKYLFSDHVRNMHHDKDKNFKSEFAGITKEPPVSKRHAEANGTKNRYVNVYAYDYCRVVLSYPDGTDYINAAFIDGYKKTKCYIAAQGPTLNTIMDFWEMVWEQKSTIIVMLTRLVEGGKTKCEQYWSEEHNAPYKPGRDLIVTTTSHKVMPGFEIRELSLTKESDASDPLLVKHFLYTAWPDHGVPQYSSSMVKFILQQIKPETEKTTAPIVVHCSAGAGRTGTFIAIDTTLDRLEEEDNINIFECVEMMRTKRTQMVQTAVQYIYIHDAINDHVACGDTAIVAQELGQKITQLNRMEPGAKSTGLEEQFYVLEGTCPETCRIDRDFGERPEVKARNRYSNLHTYSDNYIETEDDKTYVNATLIPGYYSQSWFIAAQAPLKNTIEDTWNVIRQKNCSVIVVLCDFVELGQEMCELFWPTEVGVPMTIGPTKISLMNTIQSEHYDVYELTITVEVTGDVVKVEIHHYKAWGKYGRPDVSSLLKLMGDVQRSQQGHTGPVMVMCDDGMSRTGVFITVMSEIDRVKVEGEMDIFHTVKAARKARPNMVSTVYDYELCHEIGLNYLESFDSYANLKV